MNKTTSICWKLLSIQAGYAAVTPNLRNWFRIVNDIQTIDELNVFSSHQWNRSIKALTVTILIAQNTKFILAFKSLSLVEFFRPFCLQIKNVSFPLDSSNDAVINVFFHVRTDHDGRGSFLEGYKKYCGAGWSMEQQPHESFKSIRNKNILFRNIYSNLNRHIF